MTEGGTGQGSEREESERRFRFRLTVFLSLVGSAMLGAVADRILNALLDLPFTVALTFAGVLGVAAAVGLVVRFFPPHSGNVPVQRLLDQLRRLGKGTAMVLAFASGMLLAFQLLITGAEGARRLAHDPCAERLELRVLTTPELEAALRVQAARFADAEAALAGCRPVRVSVFSASSVPDLENAFQHRWTATPGKPVLGPQPDVWIPASAETVRHLEKKGVTGLRPLGSVATSPLVMAVSDGNFPLMGSQNDQSLPQLITAARNEELTVSRANPETSEVGLAATTALYQDHSGESANDQTRRRERERWMARLALPTSDSVDLMCALREEQTRQGELPQIAALVPEHVLQAYNAGQPLGTRCPDEVLTEARLTALYPKDVRTFEYPFVQVAWPGQETWGRTHLVRRFHGWLAADRLKEAGLRGRRGEPAGALVPGQSTVAVPPAGPPPAPRLDRTLRQFRQARPAVSARFVVDISSSMGAGIPTQGSRLDRARGLLHTALKLLATEQSNDHVGLTTFPRWPTGSDLSRSELKRLGPTLGRDLNVLTEKVDSLVTAEGTSSPLFATLTDSVDFPGDSARIPALVVLTDGGDRVRQGPPGDPSPGSSAARLSALWQGALAEKLREARPAARPHLVFLTVGAPDWCNVGPVERLDAETRVDCFDATDGDAESLLSRTIGLIRTEAGR